MNQRAAASAAATDKLNQPNLSGPTGRATASGQETPFSLQHGHDGLYTADADRSSSQQATAGGEEASCSYTWQPAALEVQPTQASQQARSTADLAATATPVTSASASHLAGHERLPTVTAASANTSTAAAADGMAAATAADDKGASSSLTAAEGGASKESLKPAAPSSATVSKSGVSARPGTMRRSGERAEGQQSGAPAARPEQTAAEMLSWLDATLSAKELSTGKAAGIVAPKVMHAPSSYAGNIVAVYTCFSVLTYVFSLSLH